MTDSDTATGATPAQLAAAATRFGLFAWTPDSIASQVEFWAAKLIPADHRLIGPEQVSALHTLVSYVPTIRPLGMLPAAVDDALGILSSLVDHPEGTRR